MTLFNYYCIEMESTCNYLIGIERFYLWTGVKFKGIVEIVVTVSEKVTVICPFIKPNISLQSKYSMKSP